MTGPLPPLASPAITSEPRPATHRSFTQTLLQPAPGTDWAFVPSESDWARLLSITATLTTDAADTDRGTNVTVTDQEGNLLTVDASPNLVAPSQVALYGWRSGPAYYVSQSAPYTLTAAIPGFWLPPGATVAADTGGLDTPTTGVQATIDTASITANLPVTIVFGVNDTVAWNPAGGAGPEVNYSIAAGVYATTADVAAALNAATGAGPATLGLGAHFVDHGGGVLRLTAVQDVGADGNGSNVASAMAADAWASIVTGGTTATLAGGVDADGGDQWTSIVATYVVAYHAYWATLDAVIDQLAASR